MPRVTLALLVCLVALTALAQPGLCPCWLILDVAAIHPHAGQQADAAHEHEYLHELFPAQPAAARPTLFAAAALLSLLVSASNCWRRAGCTRTAVRLWLPAVNTPPPRPVLVTAV